ncbi:MULTISPECIES: Chromate resistance protein ChrB [unclassified Streptomyces]|uniref:Chromate resistance protein ChrB n=1 Tax=unclassified Streptomyces TaxID=2593676 RepID=UPI0012FF15D5|nr:MULTISPECIES: Chromate resistance protein ChrB [unclassified Streptomyces]
MRAPGLLAELEKETARGNATYAEVEESEADLERFDKWLARIAARDHFGAPGGIAAREAVERCRTALAAFEDAAIAAQAGSGALPASATLRAVEQEQVSTCGGTCSSRSAQACWPPGWL